MRTLADALDYGVISPVLAELWCKQHQLPSPYHAAFRQQISVILFLLGALCMSNGLWFVSKWGYDNAIPLVLLAMGGTMMFGSFLGFTAWITKSKKANLKFMRDCTQLSEFLFTPGLNAGCLGKEELYKKAEERMIFLASSLLKNEDIVGRGRLETETCRDLLKNTHTALISFGIVNARWDEYFTEAKRRTEGKTAEK